MRGVKINRYGLAAVGQIGHQAATITAQAHRPGSCYAAGEHCPDRRVHRVAAGKQNFLGRGGRGWMRCRNGRTPHCRLILSIITVLSSPGQNDHCATVFLAGGAVLPN